MFCWSRQHPFGVLVLDRDLLAPWKRSESVQTMSKKTGIWKLAQQQTPKQATAVFRFFAFDPNIQRSETKILEQLWWFTVLVAARCKLIKIIADDSLFSLLALLCYILLLFIQCARILFTLSRQSLIEKLLQVVSIPLFSFYCTLVVIWKDKWSWMRQYSNRILFNLFETKLIPS